MFGLFTLNLTDEVRKAENPFTGEEIVFNISGALSEEQAEGVIKLLDGMNATAPDDDGYRHFTLPNRTRVAVGGFTGDGKCIRSLPIEFLVRERFSTPEAFVVVGLVRAGRLFVGSTVDPDLVATDGSVADPRFYQRHSKVTAFTDAASLASWVENHIQSRVVQSVARLIVVTYLEAVLPKIVAMSVGAICVLLAPAELVLVPILVPLVLCILLAWYVAFQNEAAQVTPFRRFFWPWRNLTAPLRRSRALWALHASAAFAIGGCIALLAQAFSA